MAHNPRPRGKLVGTRVVITGASSGIGAATAIAFAEAGATLVIGARDEGGLADIARRCSDVGGAAHPMTVDVTDAAAVAAFAAAAEARLGRIDLWFSCVGVGVLGRYTDVSMAEHKQVIDANLTGHMNDAHAVLPIFLKQGRGTWVNMVSTGGFVATPYAAAYAASKFGLRGFSQALRGELSKHRRIHICDVCPTFVDTPGVDHAGNHTGAKLSLPPGALAPETVAKAVVRLATRPRNLTVVGAPAVAVKLGQLAAPNLMPAVMNGFLDIWSSRADPAPDSEGTLFTPPDQPSGPDGQRRDPDRGRKVAIAAATGAAGLAAIGAGLWWRRRSADRH